MPPVGARAFGQSAGYGHAVRGGATRGVVPGACRRAAGKDGPVLWHPPGCPDRAHDRAAAIPDDGGPRLGGNPGSTESGDQSHRDWFGRAESMTEAAAAPIGTIALVGAGEFLAPISDVGRHLLGRRPGTPRVAILSTAAAPDGRSTYERWLRQGVDHFAG